MVSPSSGLISYPRSLWWLILHVSLAKGCPDGWNKHYFWVCLGGCFWKRWVWSSRLSKDSWLMPSHMGNGNLLRAQTKQKGWRKGDFSFTVSWVIHLLPLDIGAAGSRAFRLWGLPRTPPLDWELHHWLPLLSDLLTWTGFPGGSVGKEYAHNVRDQIWSLVLGRSSGKGNGYPLQYSGLENFMDRGTQRATVLEVTKSRTWLNINTFLVLQFANHRLCRLWDFWLL